MSRPHRLQELEFLGFAGASPNGSIPAELGNLSNLEILNLQNNELSGAIPPELGKLSNLERLNVHTNGLSGPVPAELGNLPNMTHLQLDNNDLSGELPIEIGNLTELRHVSVQDNDLTGADSYANGILTDTMALVAIHDALMSHYRAWREGGGNHRPQFAPREQWGDQITTRGGRVVELNLGGWSAGDLKGVLPPEIGLLTGLEKLNLSGSPGVIGCIPASLRGIEYTGDLPLC